MYPEQLVAPMRSDLTVAGFKELKSVEAVDQELQEQKGTTLLVINSVCGCAAGAARPGIKWALQNSGKKPDHLATQFDRYSDLKSAVADAAVATLTPVRTRYQDLANNPHQVQEALRAGAARARALGTAKVQQAKAAIGLLPA